jgi:DMSO/TMAO reductase YedYZ molybdopterin-dependent catalytic subunit
MLDRVTPTPAVFFLCHLGVPRLDRQGWSLTIDGLVEGPRTIQFDELIRYPNIELASVHECCGSPFAPFEPTRRVSNVIWGGGRLADILADCWLRTGARYIWSYGADFGEFGSAVVDAYVKDLPLSRVGADVLIAYEMNSGSLLPEHGFPARLVAPRILRNPVCESPARSQFGRPSIIASSTNTAATPIVTLPSPPERQRTQAADTGGARWPIED